MKEKYAAALKKKYAAKPFPHIVLENFLKEEKVAALTAALKKQKFMRKEADLFSFSQTYDLHTVRDKEIEKFLELLQSNEVHEFVQKITGVKITKGKVDAAGFVYGDADYLLCHDDGISSRRIAYVYYLNGLKAKEGGALCLYNSRKGSPYKVVKRIFPKRNTLVLFTVSRKSHHMVEEVLGARRLTITGWFHE